MTDLVAWLGAGEQEVGAVEEAAEGRAGAGGGGAPDVAEGAVGDGGAGGEGGGEVAEVSGEVVGGGGGGEEGAEGVGGGDDKARRHGRQSRSENLLRSVVKSADGGDGREQGRGWRKGSAAAGAAESPVTFRPPEPLLRLGGKTWEGEEGWRGEIIFYKGNLGK